MPPYGCDSLALAAVLPLYNTGPMSSVRCAGRLACCPGTEPSTTAHHQSTNRHCARNETCRLMTVPSTSTSCNRALLKVVRGLAPRAVSFRASF